MAGLIRNNFLSTKCTVCNKIIEEIFPHDLLKVIVCKECSIDGSNKLSHLEDNCFWCFRKRELLHCVQCSYKCCYDCINMNLGADYMNCLNEKNWICFICDCIPIEALQQDFIKFNEMPRNDIEALAPEGADSSIDISSPFILVDESEEAFKKINRKSSAPSQDLDYILNMYEKQIQASLELEDANVPAIISEINSIKTEQLTNAIHSLKKCLAAFSSDLTNLESRVTQATASNNQATLSKLTSLLRILIQHHLFNRFSHPQARIRDDISFSSSNKLPESRNNNNHNVVIVPPVNTNNNQKMVLIMDQKWLQDPKKRTLTVEKMAIDFSEKSTRELTMKDISKMIGDSYNEKETKNSSDNFNLKRKRFYDDDSNDSNDTKADRQRRSLNTPSWLNDFKVEKENDDLDQNEIEDQEWTDYRIKNYDYPRKRGRPPKISSFIRRSQTEFDDFIMTHDDTPKRGRGRPRKMITLNDKQPRYYIPKLNGDALRTVEDDQ